MIRLGLLFLVSFLMIACTLEHADIEGVKEEMKGRTLKAATESDIFAYADQWGQQLCDSLEKGQLKLNSKSNAWFETSVKDIHPAAWISYDEKLTNDQLFQLQEMYAYDSEQGNPERYNAQWSEDESAIWVTSPVHDKKGFWCVRLTKQCVVMVMPPSKE